MLEHEVKRIFTANEQDFKRFKEIEVVNPFAQPKKRRPGAGA